ncbi:zinc-binding alcohol dehydrogenase family protein [Williamsia sp. 1138]|uniref:zinc-binding alcohol dehydrogenase family protein n=1 Tax=Williamsia sp. 1138 TaxID=1903117 RepID=UPI000A0FBB24|nr:zinc-binding alcohol dehydrogenase family protein [Williamsia sp. 1138]OZG29536.1 zinc-binding alcohol dehydrogenase family protein [Williamsia sp. 1138]
MRAWRVSEPGPILGEPIELVTEKRPVPQRGEMLLAVEACGVCRTDLHVVEGDLPVHRPSVVPGHEVVGRVLYIAEGTSTAFRVGDLVGVPWLRSTCGTCSYCRTGAENLCLRSRYTGWDHGGGYADYVVAEAAYALELPTGYSATELAPLLCAGIIGYRALKRAELPPRGRLGIYGFGGSAHLVAQVAMHQGAIVHVMTRDQRARDLALELGVASARDTYDQPPEPLDSAIVFAPIGDIVPTALEALDRGGTLSLAGIHMTDIPPLNYQRHLFHEKQIRSVESNTRADARQFLRFAQDHRLHVETTEYSLEQALTALRDLKEGLFAGAAVLVPLEKGLPYATS